MHEIYYFVYDLRGYLVIFSNGVPVRLNKRVYDLSEKNLKMKTRVYDLKGLSISIPLRIHYKI